MQPTPTTSPALARSLRRDRFGTRTSILLLALATLIGVHGIWWFFLYPRWLPMASFYPREVLAWQTNAVRDHALLLKAFYLLCVAALVWAGWRHHRPTLLTLFLVLLAELFLFGQAVGGFPLSYLHA